MKHSIFTGLSPNLEPDDVRLALSLLCKPWQWLGGEKRKKFEQTLQTWLPIRHVSAFASGRGALHAILSSLDLKAGDEVLLQAYTCVAVSEPILWNNFEPVYVDIDQETYTLSVQDLEKKISSRSKVLIVQHTFGLPADLDALLAVARRSNLFVIEDCAHALGAVYDGKKIGTFGHASFFSFGRDKVISSVFGGAAATNDPALGKRLAEFQAARPSTSYLWTFQQLIHPPLTALVKSLYDGRLGSGKILFRILRKFHILSKAVYPMEKQGGQPVFVDQTLPDGLAVLALHQFVKLEKFNNHRKELAELYSERLQHSPYVLPARKSGQDHIYLRYTIRHRDADLIRREAKKEHIILGDWYATGIAPLGVDYGRMQYDPASCPKAEQAARESCNLPTDITVSKSDAERIVTFLMRYAPSESLISKPYNRRRAKNK